MSVAGRVDDIDRYDQAVLWLMVGLSAVANVVVPVVEELYFLGHLLARTGGRSSWAPTLNTVLFSLYHLWIPWEFLGRVIAVLPMVHMVRRERGVAIGVWVHVLVNTTGTPGLLAVVLTTS